MSVNVPRPYPVSGASLIERSAEGVHRDAVGVGEAALAELADEGVAEHQKHRDDQDGAENDGLQRARSRGGAAV